MTNPKNQAGIYRSHSTTSATIREREVLMVALLSPPSEMDVFYYSLSLSMSKQAFHGLMYMYGVSPAVFDTITSLKLELPL